MQSFKKDLHVPITSSFFVSRETTGGNHAKWMAAPGASARPFVWRGQELL